MVPFHVLASLQQAKNLLLLGTGTTPNGISYDNSGQKLWVNIELVVVQRTGFSFGRGCYLWGSLGSAL